MSNLRSPLPLGMMPITWGAGSGSEIEFLGSISALGDGDVRYFDVSQYAMFFLTDGQLRKVRRSPRRGSYPVVFVNGMMGSPVKFRAQACAVAALSGGPVWGVYNGSGDFFAKKALPAIGAVIGGVLGGGVGAAAGVAVGKGMGKLDFLSDLMECATDKLQSTDWDQLKAWWQKTRGVPQHQIERDMFEALFRYNRATGSLFKKLLEPGSENARIVAHSQGNLITCNAVNAVAAVRGKRAIAKMKIFAVASPVVFWSEAGMFGQDIVSVHALANDAVAWLGANVTDWPFLMLRKPMGRASMTGSEVSDRYAWTARPDHLLTHNFYAYLERMWQELRPEFD